MNVTNETTALGCYPNAAREAPTTTPRSISEDDSPGKSTPCVCGLGPVLDAADLRIAALSPEEREARRGRLERLQLEAAFSLSRSADPEDRERVARYLRRTEAA